MTGSTTWANPEYFPALGPKVEVVADEPGISQVRACIQDMDNMLRRGYSHDERSLANLKSALLALTALDALIQQQTKLNQVSENVVE